MNKVNGAGEILAGYNLVDDIKKYNKMILEKSEDIRIK